MAKKKQKRRRILRIIRSVMILMILGIAGLGSYLLLTGGVPDQSSMEILMDEGSILSAATINGVDVSNMSAVQARAAIDGQVQRKASEIAVKLQYPDGRIELLPASAIGVYPNADEIVLRAMRTGRQGGITQRKTEAAGTASQALTLSYTYDENALEQNIRTAASSLNTAPVEPTVSIGQDGKIVVTDGRDGVALDVDRFVMLVKASVVNGTFGPVAMPGTPQKPAADTTKIRENTQLRSTFSTTFTNASASGRAKNIKKMVGILTGHILMPGQEFSVNDLAGDRTLANGWWLAPGLENGGYSDQPGGGICQVSTTLYDAALKAGLQITERRPHSIPSHYVDRAFDATVSTGGPDLKFVNNTEYPIYIIMSVDESKGTAEGAKKKVIAEIWGQPLPNGLDSIKLVSKNIASEPFDPLDVVYVTDPADVHGGRNYYADELWLYYYDGSGKLLKKEKANSSTYRKIKPAVLAGTTPTPGLSPTPLHSPVYSPTASP